MRDGVGVRTDGVGEDGLVGGVGEDVVGWRGEAKRVGCVVEDGLLRGAARCAVGRYGAVSEAGDDGLAGFGAWKCRRDVVGNALRCLSGRVVLDQVLVADSLAELVERCANVRLGSKCWQSLLESLCLCRHIGFKTLDSIKR